MFNVGDGHGLELFVAPYYDVVRPYGAARWSIKFGINWLLPWTPQKPRAIEPGAVTDP